MEKTGKKKGFSNALQTTDGFDDGFDDGSEGVCVETSLRASCYVGLP